ncbi:MAG: radical SAM protein, partial [Armatimonadota bacterium]
MNQFELRAAQVTANGLRCRDIEILQVNVGLCCNQSCAHCHLQASPTRDEMMDWPTMESVLRAARAVPAALVDVTGGAPELHPDFRRFLQSVRASGSRAQVRTNLTVLLEPTMRYLPAFLRDLEVQLVGSLPCYLEDNVNAQRGNGVYDRSIRAIQRLNAVGYGVEPDLPLNLVYNPGGPFLPPNQSELEA